MLSLGLGLPAASRLSSAAGAAPPPPGPQGPVVVLAYGQSNMVGRNDSDPAPWPAEVLIMNPIDDSYGPPGTGDLNWLEYTPGSSANWDQGPGTQIKHFLVDWCGDNPGVQVIVVPAARSGRSFADGLAYGGAYYTETLRLLDQLFTDHPQAQMLAMVVQHGEADGVQQNEHYLWDALVVAGAIRDHTATPDLPVIWGEPGAWFSDGSTALVRSHIRALPGLAPHMATTRDQGPAAYDALGSIGDDLHFDTAAQIAIGGFVAGALAGAQAAPPGLAPVRHIHQAASDAATTLRIHAPDAAPGDTLFVLAGGNAASGNRHLSACSANGDPGVILQAQTQVSGGRAIAASIARIDLVSALPGDLLTLTLSYVATPLRGEVAVWLVRGGAAATAAGNHGIDATLTGPSVSLTVGQPGAVLALAYGVDTANAQSYGGSQPELWGGIGSASSVTWSARQGAVAAGATTVTVTPATAPLQSGALMAVAMA